MKNSIEICILVDKSGSMESIKNDVIGGLNSFIDGQKKVPGKCSVSLYQFDDQYEVSFENLDINMVPKIDGEIYKTRGWTALLDAMGKTINTLGEKLAKLPEYQRPEKVLFVCQTDGLENRSKEFTFNRINEMVTHQTQKYNWDFVFLGANIDSIGVAKDLGIKAGKAMNFASNSIGTNALYRSLNNYTKSMREADLFSVSGCCFTQEDREEQDKASKV